MRHTVISALVFFLISCTENPFFKDNQKVIDRRSISGQVRLSDGRSPQNTYIWLENTGSNARANRDGEFTLRLPSTGTGGLNGEATVYLYMGNYRFETITALLSDGLFVYDKLDIDDQGRLKQNVTLQTLLTITTTVQPEQLTLDEGDTLGVRVLLQPPADTSVLIITEKTREGAFGSMYVKNAGEDITQARNLGNPSLRPFGEFISMETTLSVIYRWDDNFLLPGFHALGEGEYEIFPYIRVIQEDLPDGLISSFGDNADSYSPEYLNVPYLQSPGIFSVSE